MKELKSMYEFTVPKLVNSDTVKTDTTNGQEVKTTVSQKIRKDATIRLIKPTRRMYESADIFYSVAVGEFIKMGLLPISLIAKRYANDGGTLNEIDRARLEAYGTELKTLEKEFIALSASMEENVDEKRKEILLKMNSAGIAIEQLKNDYSSIYENTAESKARQKTAIWWVLHVSQIKKDDGTYEFLFGEGSYEERLQKYDEFAENIDPFTFEVIQRIAYLVAFWIAAKSEVGEKEFKAIDEVYLKGISEYELNDTPEVKVEEVKQGEVPIDASI